MLLLMVLLPVVSVSQTPFVGMASARQEVHLGVSGYSGGITKGVYRNMALSYREYYGYYNEED